MDEFTELVRASTNQPRVLEFGQQPNTGEAWSDKMTGTVNEMAKKTARGFGSLQALFKNSFSPESKPSTKAPKVADDDIYFDIM
jgi:tRNA U34 5-methylaminomethyl-2-thiouridine-forming methyltransferase MnmC